MMFADYADHLDRLHAQARSRRLPDACVNGAYVNWQGKRLLNCAGNDYLGLAADADARMQAARAAEGLPFTSSSSRLLTGNHPTAVALEDDLRHMYGREALLFGSGYHANVGLIPALFGRETLILADKQVHASIIDGMRLSRAERLRFPHNDMNALEALLRKHHDRYRRIAVITESVFSMDGDYADLPALVEIKRQFPKTVLYVDEAHAFGVFGHNGAGCAYATDTLEAVDILCATFGKAAASHGAFVIVSSLLKEYLINTARTLIFSTALPAAQWAVSRAMVKMLSSAHDRREKLDRLGSRLRHLLQLPPQDAPHIVPVTVGQDEDAAALARTLRAQGFYCLPIRPPTVPVGTARIRLSLSAAMSESDIERLAEAVKSA